MIQLKINELRISEDCLSSFHPDTSPLVFQLKFFYSFFFLLFYFYHVSCKDFLERLPLILVCRETKCGCHHITFLEPARSQIT